MSNFAISVDAEVLIGGDLKVAVTSEIENDDMLAAVLASTALQCCKEDDFDSIAILQLAIVRIQDNEVNSHG